MTALQPLMMIAVGSLIGWSEPPPDTPRDKAHIKSKPADDLEQLREQIARDMQAVEKKLKVNDAGNETRVLQSQILSNLDKLLERLKNPPPPNESPNKDSSPMGEQSKAQSQPGPGTQQQLGQSMTRRERREAQRRQEQRARGGQQPMGQTYRHSTSANAGNAAPTSRMPARTGPPETLADVVKDIWGHLPETVRQEVDHYYREQFMPRYRDLLQQYYLRLAESERRPRSGKP